MKTKIITLTLVAFLVFACLPFDSASAATINVVGGCTLENAINSVNAAADQGTCTSSGTYGTNDTIALTAGTITLTADLPVITKSVQIIGAGKNSTYIDANGHGGLLGDTGASPDGSFDYVFQGFSITGAFPAALGSLGANSTTLTNVSVTNSTMGTFINAAHVTVSGSTISDNTNTSFGGLLGGDFDSSFAGLGILLRPYDVGDIPSVNISDTSIGNNSSQSAGLSAHLLWQTQSNNVDHLVFNIERTTVSNNSAEKWAGIIIYDEGGTVAEVGVDLTIDSVTVSGNNVTVVDANSNPNPFLEQPYVSGMIFNGKLLSDRAVTNLTSANNSVTNDQDIQFNYAGFTASLTLDSTAMKFVNSTIVGNDVTQSQVGPFQQAFVASGNNATFFVVKVEPFAPDLFNGASVQNSLVAGNSRNGINGSCVQGDKTALGQSGPIDLTPTNLGNNISDDPFCTGYAVIPNILSTLGALQDNGGPVKTIALLPGSPAISAGVQVLGISVDARGVARSGSAPSVGAYEYVGAAPSSEVIPAPGGSVGGVAGSLPATGQGSIPLAEFAVSLILTGLVLTRAKQKALVK